MLVALRHLSSKYLVHWQRGTPKGNKSITIIILWNPKWNESFTIVILWKPKENESLTMVIGRQNWLQIQIVQLCQSLYSPARVWISIWWEGEEGEAFSLVLPFFTFTLHGLIISIILWGITMPNLSPFFLKIKPGEQKM